MVFKEIKPLYHLVKSDDNVETVRKLLPKIKNSIVESFCLETLIHEAVKSIEDNILIVQELINAGCNVNATNVYFHTPLYIAVIFRKRRVVDALLKLTNDMNSKDKASVTPLHFAVSTCEQQETLYDVPLNLRLPDLWIVRKLLDHEHINVNVKDNIGQTPLMCAIQDKQLESVKLLLNKDAKLDVSDLDGDTALHFAMSRQDPCPYTVILLLLEQANLLKINNSMNTPFDILINSQSFEFACICFKVMAFKYHVDSCLRTKLIKTPQLLYFLDKCCEEINRMKRDIIASELTILDFFLKCSPKSGFKNPLLQIYKPVVERLIAGIYPEYFHYILNRVSKSNLTAILEITISTKYCHKKCGSKNCKKEQNTKFSKIIRIGLLSEYLSHLDILGLIVTFSSVNDKDYILHFRDECYLTDSWDEYPDEHFYKL